MTNDKLEELKRLADDAQVLANELFELHQRALEAQQQEAPPPPSSDVPWPDAVAFDAPPARGALILEIAANFGVTEAVAESWLSSSFGHQAAQE